MCRLCFGIPTRETIQAVVFAIFLNICLPSFDVGSDIRLAVRLYLNEHPKWALSVLTPVFINTIFSAVACKQLEQKKAGACWIMYLPLVLLQIYPQFCTIRLIFDLLRGSIDLNDFKSTKDGLDGGIGCIEPYCESVFQVFVQTALFAKVHNLNPLVTRLCFSERDRSCAEYDVCDDLYDCDMDPYASGYEKFEKVMKSSKIEKECRATFDRCIGNFSSCILDCKNDLTQYIYALDDLDNAMPLLNSSLHQTNDTHLVQMHRLVIDNYPMFLSTYAISIVAACFGITKFFRLSHCRMTQKLLTWEFFYVGLVSTIFFGIKAFVLAGVVIGHDKSLAEAVGIWILFTKLPTTILVLVFTIIVPCVQLYKKYEVIRIGAVAQMILKQPCLLLAPHITPFAFTLNTENEKIIDDVPGTIKNGEMVKFLSVCNSYKFSPDLSVINTIVSMILTMAVFAWKSPWITSFLQIFFMVVVALALFFVVGILGYKWVGGLYEEDLPCMVHGVEDCPECTQTYGFYGEGLMRDCEDHGQAPFQYKSHINNCRRCSKISRRYSLPYY